MLLDEILLHIPPHDAAHGFRSGRSVTSFVAPHVGRTIVLKMDLRDFFVSITSASRDGDLLDGRLSRNRLPGS